MKKLNLPPYSIDIQQKEQKIHVFDIVRKKYVVLTPEEWVRQHFVNFLMSEMGYSRNLISLESKLVYNTLTKRSDIVIYDKQMKPFLLVECKAPEVKLTDQVYQQAAMYNKELKAPYLVVTNGMEHYCFTIDHGKLVFQDQIPVPPST